MKPERELRGDGLLLRPLGAKDLPRIVEACSDPLFARWLPWLRGGYTLERAEEFVTDFASSNWESGQPIWALCFEVDPDSLIGVLDLRDRGQGEWEIGYWMRPEVRGRGLMITANHLALNHVFSSLGALRVMHYARVGNTRSRNVARRLGFVPEGVRRKPVARSGEDATASSGDTPAPSGNASATAGNASAPSGNASATARETSVVVEVQWQHSLLKSEWLRQSWAR